MPKVSEVFAGALASFLFNIDKATLNILYIQTWQYDILKIKAFIHIYLYFLFIAEVTASWCNVVAEPRDITMRMPSPILRHVPSKSQLNYLMAIPSLNLKSIVALLK